jgi:acyl carrier protein
MDTAALPALDGRSNVMTPINATVLLDQTCPLVRDHVVQGLHILPGLAYVDLLFQLFRDNGHDYAGLELRDIVIHRPLIVADSTAVSVTIDCEPAADEAEAWDILIRGVDAGVPDRSLATMYVAARVACVAEGASAPAAIVNTAERAGPTRSLDSIYQSCRAVDLRHDNFMMASGSSQVSAEVVWADLAVGEGTLDEQTLFHPALLDGSALCAASVFGGPGAGTAEQALFLPISIGAFRAIAPLRERCTARIDRRSIRRVRDICYVNIEYFDERGAKIAELRDLTAKQVRESAPLVAMASVAVGVAVEVPATEAQGARSEVPLPADDVYVDRPSLRAVVTELLAQRLSRAVDQIPSTRNLYDLGLSSADLLALASEIGSRLGRRLSPTLLFEYPTLAELLKYLGEDRPATAVAGSDSRAAPGARATHNSRAASSTDRGGRGGGAGGGGRPGPGASFRAPPPAPRGAPGAI